MGDKATAKRVLREAGVATTPGTDVLASVEDGCASSRNDRLSGAAQGDGRRRRQEACASCSIPANCARAFAGATAEAEASFKDGRLYIEKLIAVAAARRGASARRRVRQHRAPRRARLLGAEAGASEAHRRDAGARTSPSAIRNGAARDGAARLPVRRLHERGHARVSGRRRRRVLHGDEHAHPSRASGDGDGLRHRPRQGADPDRGGRTARLRAGRPRARAATRSSAASTPKTLATTSRRPPAR